MAAGDTGSSSCRYGGVRREAVQTGIFHGVKRTYWIEYNSQGRNIGCYWEDDHTSRRVGVHS